MNIEKMRRNPIIHGPKKRLFTFEELAQARYPEVVPMNWMNKVQDAVKDRVVFYTQRDPVRGYYVTWRKI